MAITDDVPTHKRDGAVRWTRRVLTVVGALTYLNSCDFPDPGRLPAGSMVVGVLPDESETRIRERFSPLLDYLGNATGLDVELKVPATYDDLVAELVHGEVDLAWFGALTMAQVDRVAEAGLPMVRKPFEPSWLVRRVRA